MPILFDESYNNQPLLFKSLTREFLRDSPRLFKVERKKVRLRISSAQAQVLTWGFSTKMETSEDNVARLARRHTVTFPGGMFDDIVALKVLGRNLIMRDLQGRNYIVNVITGKPSKFELIWPGYVAYPEVDRFRKITPDEFMDIIRDRLDTRLGMTKEEASRNAKLYGQQAIMLLRLGEKYLGFLGGCLLPGFVDMKNTETSKGLVCLEDLTTINFTSKYATKITNSDYEALLGRELIGKGLQEDEASGDGVEVEVDGVGVEVAPHEVTTADTEDETNRKEVIIQESLKNSSRIKDNLTGEQFDSDLEKITQNLRDLLEDVYDATNIFSEE